MAEKIARYEILREIGRGGMATVYLAYDPNFQREVAVKVMLREAVDNPALFQRFLHEARTIASLEHPAIVPVYDFGEEDGRPFLVMRYLSGGSLAERIRKSPIPIADAAKVLLRIGSALDTAHAKGIVHRDIKPSNILFDQAGEAYLADFGIALLSETSSTPAGAAVLGTPSYMSPEQIRGEGKVDGRTDIYALGIVLFEMLTGKTPYKADTAAQVMMMHLANPTPRLSEARKDLPESVNNLLVRAMAKEPEFRFQNASEIGNVLTAIAASRAPGDSSFSQTDIILQETSISRVDLEADRRDRYGALLEKQAARSALLAPKPKRKGPWFAGGVILSLLGVAGAAGLLGLGGVFAPPAATPTPTPTPSPTATLTRTPTVSVPMHKSAPADGAIVNTGPMLLWDTVDGAVDYEYCVDAVDNNACDGSWISAESSSAILVGLTSNGTYYWQVRIHIHDTLAYADGGAWWSFTARSQTFADVPIDHPAWEYIEAIYNVKLTAGCSKNPVNFCPDTNVSRAMMAVFMLRLKYGPEYMPPAGTGMIFTDVKKTHWAAGWIEQMYRDGITTGSGGTPPVFRPDEDVTRAAFAVFILRTKYGTKYEPPDAAHLFRDMPVAGKEWMETWAEQFYREVSAAACGIDPLTFCPEDSVPRSKAAELLVRAFDIPLP